MGWLFASGSHSIGASASATVLPINIQGWFPLGLTGLISLKIQCTLKSILQHHNSKTSIFLLSDFCMVQFPHPYITTGKTVALNIWNFAGKVMSLLFNTLSRFVSFPSKERAPFNFMTAVTVGSDFGAQENKICHRFHFFRFYLLWSNGTRCHDLSFLNVELQGSFFTLLFYPYQEAL